MPRSWISGRLPAVLLLLAAVAPVGVLAADPTIAGPAAADPPPGAVTWPAAAYNPQAQPDDLLVPLPCGGALALRRVSTPGPEQGYAVSGAFSDGAGATALLVGKYEVTERQARAGAGGACPEPEVSPEAAGERPVLLSFAEALILSEQVSAWLATQAAVLPACRDAEPKPGPCLPRVDGVPAALRLPSAAEWEYAARGGLAVAAEVFGAADARAGAAEVWSAANARGAVQPIGTRQANPLGLHDLLGNAAEWVLEAEDPERPGRPLLGVARGGDARSPADAPLLAEARLWPLLARPPEALTGVRLVASVPIFTSVEKVRAAQQGGPVSDTAPPEPPPVLLTGRLRVAVDRPAEVWVDGVRVGAATPEVPFEGEAITAGERRVGVRGKGYTAKEQIVVVSVHRPGAAGFTLRPLTPAEREAALMLDGAARAVLRAELELVGHAAGAGGDGLAASERAAVRAFQAQVGLEATGYVDATTRTRLAAAAEAAVKVKAEAEAKAKAEAEAKAKAEAEAKAKAEILRGLADTMIEIPGGTFRMGCSPGDKSCSEAEKPAYEVRIASFRIGKYEVTQAQWRAVMGKNPSRFTGDDRPVERVSWNDVQAFLGRLNAGHAGTPYRLPSEAEWEYAARAGTRPPYWWGASIGTGRANCDGCGSRWDARVTAPVGSFQANAFGLHDTAGNVWEWVQDCWHDDYVGAPAVGSVWQENCPDPRRVLRGGSWSYSPWFLRVSLRLRYNPDFRIDDLGVRLAQDL
ncbi:SUMF1/EgtB/PvdO family nonheme iron enzyme [Thiocapsa marina]|uniref:SUMF1/EgtB/PvdO family nonheme iron enzyme n=1 Tax=Thiocapsa marina TaxID=244573 RepID=UPI0006836FA9|nr:SUMF1/EgtB/PvdO family nonheme iron enzyme [Thiocapsa marina]